MLLLVALRPQTIARVKRLTLRLMVLPNADLAQWIMDNLDYTQLNLRVLYTRSSLILAGFMCSYDPNNLKNQELTAVKVAGKTQYLARTTGLISRLQKCLGVRCSYKITSPHFSHNQAVPITTSVWRSPLRPLVLP
jgi:hypothetical protein